MKQNKLWIAMQSRKSSLKVAHRKEHRIAHLNKITNHKLAAILQLQITFRTMARFTKILLDFCHFKT